MPFSDPDGTTKAIVAVVCIGLILLVGAMAGMITTGDQVVAVIFAIIAGIVMHSLGMTVGKGRGIMGVVRSFIDPDGTLKIVVAMVVLTALEIYLLFQGTDGTTMYSVVVLIAGLAGYTQGKATGYEAGTVQGALLRGPKPGTGGPSG
jgi:hypothetical protein